MIRVTIPITPYTLEKLAKVLHEHTTEGATIGALFFGLCVLAVYLAIRKGKK